MAEIEGPNIDGVRKVMPHPSGGGGLWWCFNVIASWEAAVRTGSPASASLIHWWVAC